VEGDPLEMTGDSGASPALQDGVGPARPSGRALLLVEVLAGDARRRAATGRGEVGRAAEVPAQGRPVHAPGELGAEPAQAFRIAASQQDSTAVLRTPRRYLVAKTRCT
jgi:hypothetical protein